MDVAPWITHSLDFQHLHTGSQQIHLIFNQWSIHLIHLIFNQRSIHLIHLIHLIFNWWSIEYLTVLITSPQANHHKLSLLRLVQPSSIHNFLQLTIFTNGQLSSSLTRVNINQSIDQSINQSSQHQSSQHHFLSVL